MQAPQLRYASYNRPGSESEKIRRSLALIYPAGIAVVGLGSNGLVQLEHVAAGHQTGISDETVAKEACNRIRLLSGGRRPDQLFIASPDCMLIPEALYEAGAAAEWFGKLYDVPAGTTLQTQRNMQGVAALYPLPEWLPEAWLAIPAQPLCAAQLASPVVASGLAATVTLLEGQALYTLHADRRLLYCALQPAVAAADIAWQLHEACRRHKTDTSSLQLAFFSADDHAYPMLQEAAGFFPAGAIALPDADAWTPALRLFQKLEACAS